MINVLVLVLLSILSVAIAVFYRKRSCTKNEGSGDKPTNEMPEVTAKKVGVRDGEYVRCGFCGHRMRVGNGRIHLEINCESCGNQIKLCGECEDEYQKTVQQLRREIHKRD